MSAQDILLFDLQLFADGGAGAAGSAGGEGAGVGDGGASNAVANNSVPKSSRAARNPLANVQYGKAPEGETAEQQGEMAQEKSAQPTDETVDRSKAFEALIKGEYKKEFADRTQQIINDRFKQTKAMEAQMQELEPVFNLLGQRYGVDPKDISAISKALTEDDGYYEAEAEEKGLTVQQLKQFKQMERENAEFKRATQERARQENADRILQGWMQQSEQVKATYGDFDLRSEIDNPDTGSRFLGLLKNNVDVKTAYEVIHKDDIIGGAMQYAAQQTEKRVTDTIRARGQRPRENGSSGNASAVVRKSDPRTFTKADREEISRRAMRGEKIYL